MADLPCDGDDKEYFEADDVIDEKQIIEVITKSDVLTQRRIITCLEIILWKIDEEAKSSGKRNISVIRDVDRNSIVVINDIVLMGKRSVDWNDVEDYLKQLIKKERHLQKKVDEKIRRKEDMCSYEKLLKLKYDNNGYLQSYKMKVKYKKK